MIVYLLSRCHKRVDSGPRKEVRQYTYWSVVLGSLAAIVGTSEKADAHYCYGIPVGGEANICFADDCDEEYGMYFVKHVSKDSRHGCIDYRISCDC